MHDMRSEIPSRVEGMAAQPELTRAAEVFMRSSAKAQYSYNFHWMDRPIIQYPQDIVAMQELIWTVQPDLIIETGIAHGGSLVFSASMLALLDLCDAVARDESVQPAASNRLVVGVDIDIRPHNRAALEAHPMRSRMQLIEGSSIDGTIVDEVTRIAAGFDRVLVCLDSMHTHDHVLAELNAYAPLTSPGSYCVVFDTLIENMPDDTYSDRPWSQGDNPMTAVREFLGAHPDFEADDSIPDRLLISVAPGGYLRRAE